MNRLDAIWLTSFTLLAALTFAPAQAQQPAATADAALRFEAVSIKRHQPGTPQGYREVPGGRIVSEGQRTLSTIARAYGVRGTRIIGGPDWIRGDF